MDLAFWVRLSDENHESMFLTDDKFKLPPIWVLWEEGQNDNLNGREHHVRLLVRHNGKWISGKFWDLNEDGKFHHGLMITVCERTIPGEYVFHETVMSGKDCAHQCSDKLGGQCEDFCGKGGTCRLNQYLSYSPKEDKPIEYSYRCRNGYQKKSMLVSVNSHEHLT